MNTSRYLPQKEAKYKNQRSYHVNKIRVGTNIWRHFQVSAVISFLITKQKQHFKFKS